MWAFPFQNISGQPACVYWKFDADGGANWAKDGCTYYETRQGRVVCQCDHLTPFSFLSVSTFSLSHQARGMLKAYLIEPSF